MAQSPLCRGREALEAVCRTAGAYQDARTAILQGQSCDALKTLRRIGERVPLSAAKAARSCSSGQTSLTAPVADDKYERLPKKRTESAYTYARRLLSEADSRVGEGHHQVAWKLLAEAGKQAVKLSSSKTTRTTTASRTSRASSSRR